MTHPCRHLIHPFLFLAADMKAVFGLLMIVKLIENFAFLAIYYPTLSLAGST